MREQEILKKLAKSLSEKGHNNLAKDVVKLAQALQPVGEVYSENGKYYRKFYDTSKGLMIKEVDQNGNVIDPNQKKEETWGEWLSKLNPLGESKSDGFWSKVDQQNKQETANPPVPEKTNPAKDLSSFTAPTSDNDK